MNKEPNRDSGGIKPEWPTRDSMTSPFSVVPRSSTVGYEGCPTVPSMYKYHSFLFPLNMCSLLGISEIQIHLECNVMRVHVCHSVLLHIQMRKKCVDFGVGAFLFE